jgi:enterochelin esterase-like enzyme
MARVLCALLALAAAAWSVVHASEIRRETVASPALGRSLAYLVYVPDGYDAGALRYPVLYLLHGAGSDENTWTDRGHIKEKADKLIASGAMPPALIVMPGCRACWWIDGAKDKAETAFWSDLLPAVAARYRTIEAREGRVIAGTSAGGFGAIRYAMKYPERVAAVAGLSPAIYAGAPPLNSAALRQPAFLGAGGKFEPAAWASHNYPSLIGTYFSQPRKVAFYLASGDADEFGTAFEAALLFKRLFDKQPDLVKLHVIDGGHGWAVWSPELERAMTYVFRYAAQPQPPDVHKPVAAVQR